VTLIITGLVMVVVTPISWSDYRLSQRIQHGPEVVGTLHSEWVTSTSDRTGTHHTTHFDVAFFAGSSNRPIETQVSAPGQYYSEPTGSPIAIRYDPADPREAELPGHPNHTLGAAVLVTVLTPLPLVLAFVLARRVSRASRLNKRLRLGARQAPVGTGSTHVETR
jgi:hypothetical protein